MICGGHTITSSISTSSAKTSQSLTIWRSKFLYWFFFTKIMFIAIEWRWKFVRKWIPAIWKRRRFGLKGNSSRSRNNSNRGTESKRKDSSSSIRPAKPELPDFGFSECLRKAETRLLCNADEYPKATNFLRWNPRKRSLSLCATFIIICVFPVFFFSL